MIERKVDLSKNTTYKFGGEANYFLDFNNKNEEVLEECSAITNDIYILGNGSNIAFSDKGYPGLVLKSSNIGIRRMSDETLEVYSGTGMPEISRYCLLNGFSGAEFMIGIPGTIGGGLAMNAGAYKTSIYDSGIVDEIFTYNFITQSTKIVQPSELNTGYRKVEGIEGDYIYKVKLKFNSESKEVIKARHKDYLTHRKETQPSGTYNAGSVFKNPVEASAGELIDKSGLKGYRLGTVIISNKHANFFVADKNAKSADLYNLVQYVKEVVDNKFSILLEEEIRFVGDFG